MAAQTIPLAQTTDPNGNPCVLTAQYDDVSLLISSLTCTKAASYRPTLFVRDSNGTVVFQEVVAAGTTITRNVSAGNYHAFRDSEGNLQVPFALEFG